MTDPNLADILNVRFALRKLLTNTKYHNSIDSIPKEEITEEKQPNFYKQVKSLAAQIVKHPESILNDDYTLDERKKDWKKLVATVVLENGEPNILDLRYRAGHKILDHHMKHFYDVKNYKGNSVRSMITQEQMEKSLLANVRMHSTPYSSELRRMIVMYGALGSVTKYRAITAKTIVQYFGAKRVLDPCVGWGGRMLGTLATGNDTIYIGCEPDSNTVKALRDILNDSALPSDLKARTTLLEATIESSFEYLKTLEKFDMILTSPPYFNLEIYTSGDQSVKTNMSWTDWVKNWLKPVIVECISTLKSTGTSCWSVKNIVTDKKYPLADIVKEIHKENGWVLVKTIKMTGSGRPGGKRIEKGKETRTSEEETFCFQKQQNQEK